MLARQSRVEPQSPDDPQPDLPADRPRHHAPPSLTRRAPRALNLFEPPAEARTAAAMDDAAEAEQLIADLLASSTPGWSRRPTATTLSARCLGAVHAVQLAALRDAG